MIVCQIACADGVVGGSAIHRREIPPLRKPTRSRSEREEKASGRFGRNDSFGCTVEWLPGLKKIKDKSGNRSRFLTLPAAGKPPGEGGGFGMTLFFLDR
jgi:hypothetical protein